MIDKLRLTIYKLYKKENRVYLYYTFFKYVEYGLLALIYLFFAKRVSPGEYGLASLGFQTITYSSFVALGINPVLIKWYTLEKRLKFKRFYIQYNAFFNLAISIVVFLLVSIFLNRNYNYLVAGICALKIIQESSVNINRIKNRFYLINITYLSFVVIFAILFWRHSTNTYSFFICWAFSLLISTSFGFLSTINPFLRKINPKFFIQVLKEKFGLLLMEGVKLSSLSIVTPLIATSGILLLNAFDQNKMYIGNIQLADNIASIIALTGSSIIYIIMPNIIKRFSEEPKYIIIVFKNIIKYLLILIPIFIVLQLPIFYFSKFIFVKYETLPIFINLSFASRILILILTAPMSFFIAHSFEYTYTKVMMIFCSIQILLIILLLKVFELPVYFKFISISSIPIIMLLIIHYIFIKKIISKLNAM